MARREKIITIQKEGRDKGKVFKIIEMPPLQGEFWGLKALQALAQTDVNLPENFFAMPMASLANIGNPNLHEEGKEENGKISFVQKLIDAFKKLPIDTMRVLNDEIMEYVKYIPNPKTPSYVQELSVDENSIEEISTYLLIQKELVVLNLGFFMEEADPTSE